MRYFYSLLIATFLFHSCKEESKSTNTTTTTINTTSYKVDSILQTLTLEQKIGQMTQLNITTFIQDSILEDYSNVTQLVVDTVKLSKLIRDWHIGSFLNGRAVSPENWHEVLTTVQQINAKHTSIPIIYGIDHVHGASYLKNGTIFPHNINLGCSFDTLHAYHAGWTSTYETADLGHNWIFAPVLGLGRSKSWGRYYETYSEDPVVVEKMGLATIHGIQNPEASAPYKTAACAKHFLGYSEPKSGWDRSPAEIPDQILREFFLPPFKEAIDAGVKTIMINSGEINGIPVHASHNILTKLLRNELGFDGIAVTDWLDIKALKEMHYVAETEKEATYMAIMAGVDMSMVPLDTSFCVYLKELVDEGRIPISRIDESVKRILKVKLDLGLFDMVMPRKDRLERVNSQESIQKALNAARESMVLIKNENNVLPLSPDTKILLSGFTHNNKRALCGGWTYRFAADGDHWFPENMPTIKDALNTAFGEQKLTTALDIQDLKNKASTSDVIIIATGEENAYAETQGTIEDLTLDKSQTDLIKAALETNKPVVLVLTEGRPRLIPDVYHKVDAILFSGLPGIYGAQAIAEIINGQTNPSGKMSFTYPKRSGHIINYNHKKAEFSNLRPVNKELKEFSIAPFGFGLSYSNFTYHDLIFDTLITDREQVISCSVKVTNTSKIDGKEAVLWYISDEYASITRPVKELVSFEKRWIKAGETEEFSFLLDPKKHLSFPDKDGETILEDGGFHLSTGHLSQRFYLKTKK